MSQPSPSERSSVPSVPTDSNLAQPTSGLARTAGPQPGVPPSADASPFEALLRTGGARAPHTASKLAQSSGSPATGQTALTSTANHAPGSKSGANVPASPARGAEVFVPVDATPQYRPTELRRTRSAPTRPQLANRRPQPMSFQASRCHPCQRANPTRPRLRPSMHGQSPRPRPDNRALPSIRRPWQLRRQSPWPWHGRQAGRPRLAVPRQSRLRHLLALRHWLHPHRRPIRPHYRLTRPGCLLIRPRPAADKAQPPASLPPLSRSPGPRAKATQRTAAQRPPPLHQTWVAARRRPPASKGRARRRARRRPVLGSRLGLFR